MTLLKISALISYRQMAGIRSTATLTHTLALNLLQNNDNGVLPRLGCVVRRVLLGCLLGLSPVFADGPPAGEDPEVWCEANEDACTEWCANHPEEEICEEPDCE